MNSDSIVQMIMQKGIGNVNLSMFSEEETKDILEKIAEIYFRQGKMSEVMDILEHIDLKKFSSIMKPIAEHCVELGDFKRASLIYEKIGDKEMAEFIRLNFMVQ